MADYARTMSMRRGEVQYSCFVRGQDEPLRLRAINFLAVVALTAHVASSLEGFAR